MAGYKLLVTMSEAGTAISSTDFKSVLDAITNQISVSTVVEVLGIAAAAAVGLVFMWFGVRKLISVLMNAFRKGRMGV